MTQRPATECEHTKSEIIPCKTKLHLAVNH